MPHSQRESSAEQAMEEVSDIVVGVLVLVLGLIGLKMASGALDDEIYVFGLSMALFAVLFEFGLRIRMDREASPAMRSTVAGQRSTAALTHQAKATGARRVAGLRAA